MTISINLGEAPFVPVALGLLALNVLCLVVLLALRPAGGKGRRDPGVGPALLAEFLGTFVLVLVGMLVMMAGPLAGQPAPSLLVVALAHGGAIAVMAAAVGGASGGHFNPAVTLGFVFAGRLNPFVGFAYAAAQLGGAFAAAGALGALFGPQAVAATVPAPAAGLAPHVVVALEALACAVLMVVVFGTAVDRRATPGLAPGAIGLTVALGILTVGPLTGGALSPARHLAPAVVAMRLGDWLYYVAGPGVGCVLGAVLMQFFYVEPAAAEPAPARAEEDEEPATGPRLAA